MKHRIFYDNSCPFCRRAVGRIAGYDKEKIFLFVPQDARLRSLVLEEANGQIWAAGRAVLRIFWLLGGAWRLFGWLYVVPIVPDLIYRLIARFRHHF